MRRLAGRALLAGLFVAWLACPPVALAHAGAPYPVLVDEPVGPYRVSALADPDVGKGTFYVQAGMADGSALPAGSSVSVGVQPGDGHRAEASIAAERRETRYGDRYVAAVPFDARGTWQVRLLLDGPAGRAEHSFSVVVTLPGISWLGTAACLLPFVALGALWVKSATRKKSRTGQP